jgi:hypothetical protein
VYGTDKVGAIVIAEVGRITGFLEGPLDTAVGFKVGDFVAGLVGPVGEEVGAKLQADVVTGQY